MSKPPMVPNAEVVMALALRQFGANQISLEETGEYQEAGTYKQHLSKDDFSLISSETYAEMFKLRSGALAKYGADNHLAIPYRDNIGRTMRHMFSSATFKTEEGNTITDELMHVIFRLLMAADNVLQTLATNEVKGFYKDWWYTVELYRRKLLTPCICLFPSALRRVLIIMNSNEEMKKYVAAPKSYDEVLMGIDSCILLTATILDSDHSTEVLNKILTMVAILIGCYQGYLLYFKNMRETKEEK